MERNPEYPIKFRSKPSTRRIVSACKKRRDANQTKHPASDTGQRMGVTAKYPMPESVVERQQGPNAPPLLTETQAAHKATPFAETSINPC